MSEFIIRPKVFTRIALDCKMSVKFANKRVITNDHHLIGGTRWSRFWYRMRKMKMIELKWRWRQLKLFVKSILFGKPKSIQCNKVSEK